MAITTKSYDANRNNISKTMYRWSVSRWDDGLGDNVILADGECCGGALKYEARSAAKRALFEHPEADQITVSRGCYEVAEIADDQYGTVLDVNWVHDDRWIEYGWPKGHRGGQAEVEWVEESW